VARDNSKFSTFAIFANVRSGSSTLYAFFRSFGIDMAFEPFGPPRRDGIRDVRAELARIFRTRDAIKHVYPEVTPLENFELIDFLVRGGHKVIYLKRRNLVLNAVSRVLARSTGVWLPTSDRDRRDYFDRATASALDIGDIKWCVDQTRIWEAFYNARLRGDNVLGLYYEDLFEAPDSEVASTVSMMLNFLGMQAPCDLERVVSEHFDRTLRQTFDDIYQRIPNKRQIEEAFGVKLV
jgi:LPS sulfotransferase NodH